MAATKEPLTLERGKFDIKLHYVMYLHNSIISGCHCSRYTCCLLCVADVQRAIELLDILQESEYIFAPLPFPVAV